MTNIDRNQLLDHCNQLLDVNSFKDYCPNGLQVEGKAKIEKIVSGVTASLAFVEAAIEAKADAILVHHGYFWRSEALPVTGMKQRRLKKLLMHDINLLAYHLPLDAHKSLGNNAQLAKRLNIEIEGVVKSGSAKNLLFYGNLEKSESLGSFAASVEKSLDRKPLAIAGGEHDLKKVALCTGGAQHFIQEAADLGVDLFLSGEISESTTHAAHELGIHYISAGHHATERYGVQALGQHLVEEFGIQHEFIELNNPV